MVDDVADLHHDNWVTFSKAGTYKNGVIVGDAPSRTLSNGDYLGIAWDHSGIKSYYNGMLYGNWMADEENLPNATIESAWNNVTHPTEPLWVVIQMKGVRLITAVEKFPVGQFSLIGHNFIYSTKLSLRLWRKLKVNIDLFCF